jgi:hypothetical protein
VSESLQIIKHLEQIDKHLVGLMILFFGIALVVLFVAAYWMNRNK